MREILFRGKRTINGDWVYGDFVHGNERKSLRDSIFVYDSETQSFNDFEINPSTLGQYTGLKDKNGKKIFEGDIIAVPFEEDRSPWEENCIYYENGKVYFDEMRFGWYVKFNDDELTLWEYDDCGVEIIGNVHDNPELLEK